MEVYVKRLTEDERTLEEKIKRKSLEIERTNKKLNGIGGTKPAFMEEMERLEKELEKYYSIYLDKFRNLDYLE